MDVIKTYIPRRYRSKKLVNSSSGSGSTTVINSGSSDFSPSAFVDSDTFYSMFEYDAINDAIKAKKEFYSVAGITAYGTGTVGGGGGAGVTVYNGLDSTDISLALSANMGKQLNDTKLNISAISAWALASVKPAYTISEITGLTAEFSKYSLTTHAHAWSAITDKPTTFTPSAHTHAFADLTSKPTTLSGYGITDALLSSVYTAHAGNQNAEKHLTAQQLSDLLALLSAPATFWKLDVNGNLYTDKNVYSTLGISAYGSGTGGSGGTGASALYQLVDASISSPAVDHLLVYNGTHWQNRPKSYLLADYSLTTHGHTFASITVKPTTLSGYGITDALLASAYTASDVLTKLKTVDGSGTGLDADLLDGKHGSYFCDYDERTLGHNVNYNTISYDFQNKSFIVSPVHSKNFTGQTNYPFDVYGQMITFGGLNTSFPFQLAVSENATKVKIRSKYRPTNNTVIDAAWADVYTSNSANRTDVDWAAKNMTVQTDIITNFKAWTKDSSKSLKLFLDKFDIDAAGNLVIKTNLYSTGEVTAYSSGTGISGLKLMGDLNANAFDIFGARSVSSGLTIIGDDPLGLIDGGSTGIYCADNDGIIAAYSPALSRYFYGHGYVYFDIATMGLVSPKVSAGEFKFGNWTFRQDASGRLGIYNGATEVACFNTDGTYVNL